jgi:succinate dehydrogenase hydrophobic anchor subunit
VIKAALMKEILTIWALGFAVVWGGYAIARNGGRSAVPWWIIMTAAVFWPITLVLTIGALAAGRRL